MPASATWASSIVVPSIQINARIEGRESGPNADVENSGATLVYLSPGVNFQVVRQRCTRYLFAQVPIYQRVNGLQLEPRYTVTVGRLLHDVTRHGIAATAATRVRPPGRHSPARAAAA